MKARLYFTLLLAVALCFYGCTKTEYIYVTPDDDTVNPSEETDPDNSGEDSGDSSGDIPESDGSYGDDFFGEQGDGSKENPYTVSQALEIIDKGTYNPDMGYYVKGIVSRTGESNRLDGGYLICYYLSEDGGYRGTNLYVYLGYGLGGEVFNSPDDLSVGDKVIVYGRLSDSNQEMLHGKLCYWNGETAEVNESLDGDDSGNDDNDDGKNEDDDQSGDDGLSDNNGLPDLEEVDDVCTKMTDSEFIQYCLTNFDTNNDGKLSMEEAAKIYTVNCSAAEDFAGIEYFSNLQSLISRSVKYVDLRYNTELSSINLGIYSSYYHTAAPIEYLDLSYNIKLTTIEKGAFYKCTNLASILLPAGLTSIGAYAFYCCDSLKSIDIPDCITELNDYTFFSSGLTSIKMPDGITTIGRYAFQYCSDLLDVSFPENLTTIGASAFYYCCALTSIVLPNNLTTIESGTFGSCNKLTSITLPENLTVINSNAFIGCTDLISLVFPESLTTIGESAFSECSSLNTVSVKATTPPSLEDSAFLNIYKYAILYAPIESLKAYVSSDWGNYFSHILAL